LAPRFVARKSARVPRQPALEANASCALRRRAVAPRPRDGGKQNEGPGEHSGYDSAAAGLLQGQKGTRVTADGDGSVR
jgi:hypothetical protein